MHWGEGDTPVAMADVDLETPRGESRVEGVPTQQTIITANDAFDVVGTLVMEGTPGDICEAGLFFEDIGDTLFNRVVFAPIALGVDDGIQLTFRIRFANVAP